ncbi:hypothetical protein L2D08_03175 [Domibacillus sp. PGB-M46]|nr:hypothetical protein [Domibacillus sp. PGB-M46]MCI2253365.1 hypothetical protein [Domibacillus sp. PGB-M46]
MNGMDRRCPGSSAFHGAGAEPDPAWQLNRSPLPVEREVRPASLIGSF